MSISAGTRLGPYEILSRLGAGGMGEVWKARDTRLDRSVAIKVLPAQLSRNVELNARFEREARAISQLNHPHICTLHDVGSENGTSYLVMELLDGESLAERISRGPLSFAETLRYGAQIASALDRAHRAGIVHRDLKPANVMLTRSGAKLVDFGLARTAAIQFDPNDATQQKALTQEGTIVGTFQYMSPEQLEGAELDSRSDIFALGALLYEMATGRRAFDGKTRTSLIAAIVAGEPRPISELQPIAPAAFQHVVTKCLSKDREERWQSAHDIAEELKWIESAPAQVERLAPRARLIMPLMVLLALAALVSSALYLRERTRPAEALTFEFHAQPGYELVHAAPSPDGQSIAYTAKDIHDRRDLGLWIRRLGDLEPRRITEKGVPVDSGPMRFSPDGRWLAFFHDDRLKRVPTAGGKPEILTMTGPAGYGVGIAWSREDELLFAPRFSEGLFRIKATGGEVIRVTSLDVRRRETVHAWPQFLSDQQRFVYLIHRTGSDPNEIFVGSLDGKLKKFLMNADALAGLWRSRLLFVRDGVLYEQRLNERDLTLSGEPRKIADDVAYVEKDCKTIVNVADDGTLLYAPSSNLLHRSQLGWYDVSGRLIENVTEVTGLKAARPGADESRITISRFDPRKGAHDVFVYDVARESTSRMTSGRANNDGPIFDPAGDRFFFTSDREGMFNIYVQADDPATPAELFFRSADDSVATDLSRDGRQLLVSVTTKSNGLDTWLVPATPGEKPRAILASEANEQEAVFSPDGTMISYSSDISGRSEVFVKPLQKGKAVQVSTDGGGGPDFSADGKRVFFDFNGRIAAVSLFDSSGALRPGKPAILFKPSAPWLATSRNEDRFLIATRVDPTESRVVVRYLRGFLK